jgi:hypothetical protein
VRVHAVAISRLFLIISMVLARTRCRLQEGEQGWFRLLSLLSAEAALLVAMFELWDTDPAPILSVGPIICWRIAPRGSDGFAQ